MSKELAAHKDLSLATLAGGLNAQDAAAMLSPYSSALLALTPHP